jgi:putative ABC transport system ATP-binding protein
VAIARSLANDPLLLYGDEPTGNLDTKTADTILGLFARLHDERGVTRVVVTHSDEVAERADRVIHIRDGQVTEDGRTAKASRIA